VVTLSRRRGLGARPIRRFGPGQQHVDEFLAEVAVLPDSDRSGIGPGYDRRDSRLDRHRERIWSLIVSAGHEQGALAAAREAAQLALPPSYSFGRRASAAQLRRGDALAAEQDFADAAVALVALPLSDRLFHFSRVASMCCGAAWRFGDSWRFGPADLGY
jgi:hypothetical protein